MKLPLRRRPERPGDSSDRPPSRLQRAGERLRVAAPPKGTRSWGRDFERGVWAFYVGIGELLAIAREMLMIVSAIALALAERLGAALLVGWRWVLPHARTTLALLRRVLGWLEREVTPRRAITVVTLVAIVALGVSQFVDYRVVRAGAGYEGVRQVVEAPSIEGGRQVTGTAHSFLVMPLAVAALGLLAASVWGRWQLARLLAVIGLAVVAITILVDIPAGLDEGEAAVAYQDANAELLDGVWAQLAAGAALIALGPLLAMALRPRPEESEAAPAPRRRRRPELRGSHVQGARP